MPNSDSGGGVLALLGGASLFVIILSLAIAIFFIYVYWRIVSKAGYNGAMSLLLFVPIANIIMILIFAFSEWPIQKELNSLRQQLAMRQQSYPQQQMPQQYPQSQQYQQPQQYQQYPQNRQ